MVIIHYNDKQVSFEPATPEDTKSRPKFEVEAKFATYVDDSFGLMVAIELVEERSNLDFSRGGK